MIENNLSFARTMAASAFGVALGLAVASANTAHAADDLVTEVSTSSWTISGGAAVTTDYVFRGFTQSSEDPAIQGYGEIGYGIFYAGIWGSSVNFSPVPPDASVELDFYAGVKPTWGITEWDFGVIYYAYPGASDLPGGEFDYVEFKAAVSVPVGQMLTLGAALYYSPEFFGEVGDAVAVEASAEIALPHNFAISGTIGTQTFDNNVLAGPDWVYWNIGASYTWRVVTFDLRYHDTDLPAVGCANLCDERIVGTISVDFSTE